METCPVFNLDNTDVLFTPDGRISVFDAIKAVTRSSHPYDLWEKIYARRPSVMEHCALYRDESGKPFLVADIAGWDTISALLFEELTLGRE